MSKGSRPRPYSISQAELGSRLEGIFQNEDRDLQKAEKAKADAEYWANLNAETAARLAEADKKA